MGTQPQRVQIVEVGPRDGLQNEPDVVPTDVKVAWIDRLSETGLKRIEVTSFVNPRWIPALADAEEVMRRIRRAEGVQYSALVPNVKGLERAAAIGVEAVAVFMSASETHNRKNINKSIADTYPVLAEAVQEAKAGGMFVRGYVSTAFGCPCEGRVPVEQVREVSLRLLEMGIDELSVGDTIGVATPADVHRLVDLLLKDVAIDRLALHFHDTYGMAIANIYAAMEHGVYIFDASSGGLGGCPYAPGATGNVATEDVLYLMRGCGVETGVSFEAALGAAEFIEGALGRTLPAHNLRARRGASCSNDRADLHQCSR
ncbi:hydroxymethylglutaryl-CoA lyase [Kyrpidia spormannii]|uniref:Hydroxymethylglutaryl-CoA lyase (Leucine degradation) n=1 Tax=Kyrpidia spormannii TaxID=2055160 RepID=A0A6F9E822_9BACL|nr:hydroxymethylglutaryl-CoA lyase [Kyrpidia spormannii]CAB3392683.1 hydroxymethylglutaryl-CoA lyase (leucine degradation) [Kyrpidia spormannii]